MFEPLVRTNIDVGPQERIEGAIKVLLRRLKVSGAVVLLSRLVLFFHLCDEIGDRVRRQRLLPGCRQGCWCLERSRCFLRRLSRIRGARIAGRQCRRRRLSGRQQRRRTLGRTASNRSRHSGEHRDRNIELRKVHISLWLTANGLSAPWIRCKSFSKWYYPPFARVNETG